MTDGYYISVGNTVEVQYYGKIRQLCVTQVKGPCDMKAQHPSSKPEALECTELQQKFAALNVCTSQSNLGCPEETKNSESAPGVNCVEQDGDERTSCAKAVLGEANSIRGDLALYISSSETCLLIRAHGDEEKTAHTARDHVTFASIGGLQHQIQLVREMTELPLKQPELFSTYGA